MNFGSFGASFGSFGSGVGGLLPSFTNITSWLRSPTTDGKTLANSKGVDANLTGVNCLDFDGSGDRVSIDSAGGVDLTTNTTNNFGSCVITATFKQESAGTQVIHSCGSTSYRLWTQNGYLKLNGIAVEIFPIEQNKVYRSTVTFNESGQATNFVLENLTDGTTQTNSTVRNAGGHGGTYGFQIGARTTGLVWNGKISNVSVTNSSVGANLHLPLAEGSGSVAYDVSGNGANGAIVGATHSTLDGIESWNHEYGFSVDGSVKVPALNTKTTQVATFDGVADRVDFDLGTFNTSAWTCKATIKTASTLQSIGDLFSQAAGTGTGRGWLRINSNGSATTFLGGLGSTTLAPSGTFVVNTKYDVELVYNGSNSLQLKTTTGGITTTHSAVTRTVEEATGSFKFFIGHTDAAPLKGTAFSMEVVGLTQVDFQNNIGTTTVVDNSGNGNNGTVTVGAGGLDTFWGTRVADTAGSLVSADYATGNLTISNPGGFVHNGSECGVDMVTNDLTSTQLFAINNATATETFVRKDNGNIVQILDYSAPLTGDDLTRTRNYVG